VRRSPAIAAAGAAIVAGVACVFAGRAVLQERSALTRADVGLAAPIPSTARVGGNRVAVALLDAGTDRAARAAAAAYARARAAAPIAVSVRNRALAEQALAPLAAAGPASQRSWASTLLGALELDQAQLDPRSAKQHVARSTADLAAAVAVDPTNEDAKRDLELLLTLQQNGKQKKKQQQGHDKPQQKSKGKKTASLSPAGSGW
jgi:hypothetical protein